MHRTPEQIDADAALTAAIERVIATYYPTDEGYVLSEYVTVTCQQRFDDDGTGISAVSIVCRDGDVPVHRALGLLNYAAARMSKVAMHDPEG
jgi:hypothetical protein